jgi:exopolysaccharide biosynthesis polyprenyl glycosylphosphotransferase
MKKNVKLQVAKYVFFDGLAAIISYTVLYYARKTIIERQFIGVEPEIIFDNRYLFGIAATTLFWLLLYWITGFYEDIFRRSRLRELMQTFNSALFGSIVIFFALILDDWVVSYTDYYQSFFTYFFSILLCTSVFRFIISTRTNRKIQSRRLWFNTLLIGSNEKAAALYKELESQKRSTGNKFVGFASVYEKLDFLIAKDLPQLGSYTELPRIIKEYQIEEVIIATESQEHGKLEQIVNLLENTNVRVKIIPDMYDIISGQVKMESLGAPLIEIRHELIAPWQHFTKRLFDIVVSLILLILLSPLLIFAAIMVRISSPGPIFYRQTRVGLHGKYFKIIKFRSMRNDAEQNGPQLSTEDDDRITSWGRIMRKYRLDELPQFFNVLIGEMSIVGPRPERQYYIDQILAKAPHYSHVQKVKPGITSWGMVKFGYAENVDEMVERLKYDLIYIENMNLLNDFKILFYTILIVLQGRGQ